MGVRRQAGVVPVAVHLAAGRGVELGVGLPELTSGRPSLEDLSAINNMTKRLKSERRIGDVPIPGCSGRVHVARTGGNSTRSRTPLRLELAAFTVLAPQAFVLRHWGTLAVGNLDETLLRRRCARPATSNKVFKGGSVPLKCLNLVTRKPGSVATKCEADRRLGHQKCPGEAFPQLLTARKVHQQQPTRRGGRRTQRSRGIPATSLKRQLGGGSGPTGAVFRGKCPQPH